MSSTLAALALAAGATLVLLGEGIEEENLSDDPPPGAAGRLVRNDGAGMGIGGGSVGR